MKGHLKEGDPELTMKVKIGLYPLFFPIAI